MTREVYYFDSETTEYSISQRGEDSLWVFEFLATRADLRKFRTPRCLMSSRSGGAMFRVERCKLLRGPKVEGRHRCRVVGTRLLDTGST